MKICFKKISGESASALIVTLTLGVILLVVLATYLTLLTSQKNIVTRSQTWNAALTMAEAGIEEGMAQLNQSNTISMFTTNINTSIVTNFANSGWGPSGSSGPLFGPMTRTTFDAGSGAGSGRYSVVISNTLIGTLVSPTLYSTGYATVPVTGGTIERHVAVTAQVLPLFNVGIGAVSNINANGNSVLSDSYDSSNPNFSTNGQYTSSMTRSNGNVASQEGIVNLGNNTIEGSLYLGPDASYTGSSNNVSGIVNYSSNVQYPDVQLPVGAANWPTAAPTVVSTTSKGKTTTVTYFDFTTSGNYILNTDAYPIYVEPGVTVNLNVTSTTFAPSDLEIHSLVTNSVTSVVSTNSGTAVMYLNGPTSVGMAGNSAIDAQNRPENLWYFGLPSLTSITFSGTSSFVGVIYAPDADLTLNGGGNGFGIMGSVIVRSITEHGHYDFHYDESLAHYGPSRGYVANSWKEY